MWLKMQDFTLLFLWLNDIPLYIYAAATAKSLPSCPALCDPIDGSPPGSSIPGILQARILEWVAISFSKARKLKVKVQSLSRVQLSHPMDCSRPGSSIHGNFQARVLEWAAIAFSVYIYIYTPQFLYPFIHPLTVRLFPYLDYCK